MPQHSMVDLKSSHRPIISYRPIQPSDREVIEQIHSELFPIRYESEFYNNVVNGHGIVSWGAVDHARPPSQCDELVGFVTVKIVLAKETEICDLLSADAKTSDQTLVYILTLGVVETYRNVGIASSLINEVIRYSSSISSCRAVYLHVISYNAPAIHLYKKMSFKCVRRLNGFYLINGQHYDAYLFVYYVNGGRSPCSPLELAMIMVTYMRSGIRMVTTRFWRSEERKQWKSTKCKEKRSLMTASHSKRNLAIDGSEFQSV